MPDIAPPEPPAPSDAPSGPKDIRQGISTLLRPALMLLVLACGALLLPSVPGFRHLLDDTATLRLGLKGRSLFTVCGALWCLFGLPRQVLCFAAGLAYGLMEGTLLATLATVMGAAACFGWARWGGRHWAQQRLGIRDNAMPPQGFRRRLAHLGRATQQHPFTTIVTLRLLPVGSSLLLNLFAGVSGLPFTPFVAATTVGSLPQTIIFVLLGSGVQLDGRGQIVMAALLFLISGLLGMWLLRRSSTTAEPPQTYP